MKCEYSINQAAEDFGEMGPGQQRRLSLLRPELRREVISRSSK